jgi:hypothetical protein
LEFDSPRLAFILAVLDRTSTVFECSSCRRVGCGYAEEKSGLAVNQVYLVDLCGVAEPEGQLIAVP